MENGLNKVYSPNQDDSYKRIQTVLGLQDDYHEVAPTDSILVGLWSRSFSSNYVHHSKYLYCISYTYDKEESIEERLPELMDLEESIFIVDFHQTVEKERKKAWHDRHIN